MTKLILVLFFFILTPLVYSQDDDVDSVYRFYVLEETWTPNNSKRFSVDDSPNYLIISEGMSTLDGRVRGTPFYFTGKIDGYKFKVKDSGNELVFYVRGREFSMGQLASFEIIEISDTEITIHVFQKMGDLDRYFSAHIASEEEVAAILKYKEEH